MPDADLTVISCQDAALINDGREIFVINALKNIMSYADGYCVYRNPFPIIGGIKLGPCMLHTPMETK